MNPLLLILGLVLAAMPLLAAEEKGEWIALRVADSGLGQAVHEYYGHVSGKIFAQLTESPEPIGFFEMTRTSFMKNESVQPLATSEYKGWPYGYTGTMYVRAETVLRVIPLDEDFVKQTLLPALDAAAAKKEKYHPATAK